MACGRPTSRATAIRLSSQIEVIGTSPAVPIGVGVCLLGVRDAVGGLAAATLLGQ
ncbi:hypothetical protein [Fodinicola feengrottensis]|uniref:hypothetical protein n=1 Tax=Fodinicola feengrottensis TaxID=435914 RepID=UPI0013D728EC|nr:hypothetical protein [Fodinicola feengrottensis]